MSLMNMVEIALFSGSLYFATDIFYPKDVIGSVKWQIGVFCVFAGWMNLIMFLRKVCLISLYIVIPSKSAALPPFNPNNNLSPSKFP